MDVQLDAIAVLLKEKPLYAKLGQYLLENPKHEYIVDDLVDQFKSDKSQFQSDATFRGEIVQFLQKLEKYGTGEFTAGRRQMKSRFSFSPGVPSWLRPEVRKILGALGISEKNEATTTTVIDRASDTSETIRHKFLIRRGFEAEFELPVDISEHEAERLASFIRNLPLK